MNLYKVLLSLFLISQVSGSFSEHIILTPEVDAKHSIHQPKLSINSNNPNFIDIEIPYNKNKSYWVITTSKQLLNTELEFRWTIWNNKPSGNILQIVQLNQTQKKDTHVISLTIHKDQLQKTYVYYDYETIVKGGGYYYTYDFSKYQLQNKSQ